MDINHDILNTEIGNFVTWINLWQSHAKRMHKRWERRDDKPYTPMPYRRQFELLTPRRKIDWIDEHIIVQAMSEWKDYREMEIDEHDNKIWRHKFTGDLVCITYRRGNEEIRELCVYNERDLQTFIDHA